MRMSDMNRRQTSRYQWERGLSSQDVLMTTDALTSNAVGDTNNKNSFQVSTFSCAVQREPC